MLIAIHFDTIYYLKFIITLLNIENYSHFTYSLKKKRESQNLNSNLMFPNIMLFHCTICKNNPWRWDIKGKFPSL